MRQLATASVAAAAAVAFRSLCHAACPPRLQPPKFARCTCVTRRCCLQVRANSLQELVYKQGQAGITKATVSIVFDNREKERGPVRAA